MAMHQKDKHEFALYWAQMPSSASRSIDKTWHIEDKELVHRITKILRLKVTDTVIFFNADTVLHCTIEAFKDKNTVTVYTHVIEHPAVLKPTIVALVPVLKRVDFEAAIGDLTILGVTTIIPVHTKKSSTETNSTPDRLLRIAHACAEQSKQFLIPAIHPTLSLEKAINHPLVVNSTKIFFDPHGENLKDVLLRTPVEHSSSYTLLIGPEGDLTPEEKHVLATHHFQFCSLTPSILRAHQAIFLGAGIIRSWHHSLK